jgi:hypothetical protein
MGVQYDGDRKIYKALGYPDDKKLDYDWFMAKYLRQDIAAAIIDKPTDKTWNGELDIVEPDTVVTDSTLNDAWHALDEELKIKNKLLSLDKLTGIGEFGLLLLGFNDVKERADFKEPCVGKKELVYVQPIGQGSCSIKTVEEHPNDKRYGMPLIYEVMLGTPGKDKSSTSLQVHHTRILHIAHGGLTSDTHGMPRLKQVANRLLDLEKILGGSAEMYWRGARPGYSATTQKDYEVGTAQIDALHEEIDKYEHDLRRILTAQGFDIKALEQQVADPMNHIDVQLQAISAKTEIPKRILVGSERGELASTQDKETWLGVVQTRMEEFAEPIILRPFIDKMMEHGVLPKIENYNVIWEDLFSPSDEQKVDIGKKRAETLKAFADSMSADSYMTPEMVFKHLLAFSPEEVDELLKAMGEIEEKEELEGTELEQQIRALEGRMNGNPPIAQGGVVENGIVDLQTSKNNV